MDGLRYASYAEWYRQGPLSSYVRAVQICGDGMTIIEASQPAGDMSDPPVSELILMRTISVGIPFEFDFGAGRFSGVENYGDFHLAAPNTPSSIEVHDRHSAQLFSLPERYCTSLLDGEDCERLDFGELHSRLFRSELLNALCHRLIQSLHGEHRLSPLFADGAAMAMLGELRLLTGRPREETRRPGVRDWRIRRAIDHLEARLGEEIRLSELAAVAQLSPSRFTSVFKAATGLAPHAWLLQRKVERACELLRDPKHSVTEISFRLGFSSSQHFATSFKMQKGVTPTAWRRERLS